jgi:hypothetical protein
MLPTAAATGVSLNVLVVVIVNLSPERFVGIVWVDVCLYQAKLQQAL